MKDDSNTIFVLDALQGPKYELEIHLLWEQCFRIYKRMMEKFGEELDPKILERQTEMLKDLQRYYLDKK
jgi:hypothetical protein